MSRTTSSSAVQPRHAAHHGEQAALPLRGIVLSGDRAIAGARVAVVDPLAMRAAGRIASDIGGKFGVEVPPGRYVITVTAQGFLPTVLANVAVATRENTLLRIHMDAAEAPGSSSIRLAGTVYDQAGRRIPGLAVTAMSWNVIGEVYYTETDANGRYEVLLRPADTYYVAIDSGDYCSPLQPVPGRTSVIADLHAVSVRSLPTASPGVLAQIRREIIELRTTNPGSGSSDFAALDDLVKNARVVGAGEATHGTREFFQLKHRLFEYLVRRHGFTVFAIEASWPDAEQVNRYIQTGVGNPREAIAGMHFWTWDTQEVLELVEWMRAHNARAAHSEKLAFIGVDMQFPAPALAEFIAYLDSADAAAAKEASAALAAMDVKGAHWYRQLPASVRDETYASLKRFAALMDSNQSAYSRRTSADSWVRARQHLRILEQIHRTSAPPPGSSRFDVRDQSMAENVHWILRQAPDSKIMVWAHNGHVARGDADNRVLGYHLSQSLGDAYTVFGFAFAQGSFQAHDGKPPEETKGVVEHTAPPPPPHYLESSLAAVGPDIYVLNLRGLLGEAAQWFRRPRPMRWGSLSFRDNYRWPAIVAANEYDALIFVRNTTRARPLPSLATRPGTAH